MTTMQLKQNTVNDFLVDSSSLQVKMFIHSNPKDAERAITQWLKENDVTLHHITQSQSERGGSFVFVLTIFYLQNN